MKSDLVNSLIADDETLISELLAEHDREADALIGALEQEVADALGELLHESPTEATQISTPSDAALWMLKEADRRGLLRHETVVQHFSRLGRQFTRRNNEGNLVIGKEVLREFLRLTKENYVWSRKDRVWRKRRSHDPPRRLVP